MTQSIEDHMTASEEGEDSQRSKLLSKMSRLGGQAILPPGALPNQHVSEGVWLWVWSDCECCREKVRSSKRRHRLLPSLEWRCHSLEW